MFRKLYWMEAKLFTMYISVKKNLLNHKDHKNGLIIFINNWNNRKDKKIID